MKGYRIKEIRRHDSLQESITSFILSVYTYQKTNRIPYVSNKNIVLNLKESRKVELLTHQEHCMGVSVLIIILVKFLLLILYRWLTSLNRLQSLSVIMLSLNNGKYHKFKIHHEEVLTELKHVQHTIKT